MAPTNVPTGPWTAEQCERDAGDNLVKLTTEGRLKPETMATAAAAAATLGVSLRLAEIAELLRERR